MKPKKITPDFPSVFGSHRSMVDDEASKETLPYGFVVCVDENGPYSTEEEKLDSGLADPNRYQTKRLRILLEKRGKEQT